eukprot:Gb_21380 [translate_table: standard]
MTFECITREKLKSIQNRQEPQCLENDGSNKNEISSVFSAGRSFPADASLEALREEEEGEKLDWSKVMYEMLPKGPVAPSGPSPCHNRYPADTSTYYPCTSPSYSSSADDP